MVAKLLVCGWLVQLESGESRSGSSISLSKPLPAVPSSRQSSDLSATSSAAGSAHGPGKSGRYTPSIGTTQKSGEPQRSPCDMMRNLCCRKNGRLAAV